MAALRAERLEVRGQRLVENRGASAQTGHLGNTEISFPTSNL
jgi:hypothetical protein